MANQLSVRLTEKKRIVNSYALFVNELMCYSVGC